MRSFLTVIVAMFVAVNFTACSRGADKAIEAARPSSAVVVIYGSLNSNKFGDVYYGEDTRGKMYVIERGKFNLDLNSQPVMFVRISDFKGKWYIEKVLPPMWS